MLYSIHLVCQKRVSENECVMEKIQLSSSIVCVLVFSIKTNWLFKSGGHLFATRYTTLQRFCVQIDLAHNTGLNNTCLCFKQFELETYILPLLARFCVQIDLAHNTGLNNTCLCFEQFELDTSIVPMLYRFCVQIDLAHNTGLNNTCLYFKILNLLNTSLTRS